MSYDNNTLLLSTRTIQLLYEEYLCVSESFCLILK